MVRLDFRAASASCNAAPTTHTSMLELVMHEKKREEDRKAEINEWRG